jgi:hypothetical protein
VKVGVHENASVQWCLGPIFVTLVMLQRRVIIVEVKVR